MNTEHLLRFAYFFFFFLNTKPSKEQNGSVKRQHHITEVIIIEYVQHSHELKTIKKLWSRSLFIFRILNISK